MLPIDLWSRRQSEFLYTGRTCGWTEMCQSCGWTEMCQHEIKCESQSWSLGYRLKGSSHLRRVAGRHADAAAHSGPPVEYPPPDREADDVISETLKITQQDIFKRRSYGSIRLPVSVSYVPIESLVSRRIKSYIFIANVLVSSSSSVYNRGIIQDTKPASSTKRVSDE